MAAVDEQQRTQIAVLKGTFLERNTPRAGDATLQPAQMLAEVALMLALPAPTTAAEASEQIEALQSLSLRNYAAAHTTWAYPVMSRVQSRLPDPGTVKSTQPNGTAWTPTAWRSYVAMLLS